MRISSKDAIAGLAVSLLSMAGMSAATAQEILISPAPVPARTGAPLEYQNTVNQAFNDAYFDHDRTFYKNRTLPRQLDWLFGFSGFPEQEITWDGKSVNDTLQQALARQMASGPIIRVFDLPSPFCQSMRTLPVQQNCFINGCATGGCPVVTQPVAPPTPVPPIIESVPQTTVPTRPQPQVPALW